jgi:acyl carrier protein
MRRPFPSDAARRTAPGRLVRRTGAVVLRPGPAIRPGRRRRHGLETTQREVPTVASVEERVIEIVCENLGVNKDQVTRKTSFQEDVGADSLDIVELVMELEEEFEITIPDDQAEKIKTVGEAIDYIEREQAKK